MAITINGNGAITGLSAGGLPAGSVTSATLASGLANQGITQHDEWRVSADYNVGTSSTTITSNWARNDTHFSYVGSGMSESSGIFTFPETGIYLIIFGMGFYKSSSQIRYGGMYCQATTDNFSSVDKNLNETLSSLSNDASAYTSTSSHSTFDVTNVSTHKVKFNVQAEVGCTGTGSTHSNRTFATFIRLGGT